MWWKIAFIISMIVIVTISSFVILWISFTVFRANEPIRF